MPNNAVDKNFVNKRYHTLILRLSVDKQGEFQGGVMVDLSARSVGKFWQLAELPHLVAHWLKTAVHGQGSTYPDNPA